MATFKTTYNILVKADEDEFWDDNFMDSDKPIYPPKVDWTYDREMQVEDVSLWEVIFEAGWFNLYAAWDPYAEFYMLLKGWDPTDQSNNDRIETFYGPGCQERLYKRLKELNIPFQLHDLWVPNDQLKNFT